MNRIHAEPTYQDIAVPSELPAVGSAVYSPSTRGTDCALFAPLHYEKNYAYPLIVWLHGPGGDEGQLKRIMPCISTRNYAAVAPRGTAAVAHIQITPACACDSNCRNRMQRPASTAGDWRN